MKSEKPNPNIHDLLHIKSLLRKCQSCCHDAIDYTNIYELSNTSISDNIEDEMVSVINHIQEIINEITF